LINQLRQKGCQVHTYDPLVQLELPGVSSFIDQYEALDNSDALIIATEWEQFPSCDWAEVKARMKGKLILDARNCLDGDVVRSQGLIYLGVGQR